MKWTVLIASLVAAFSSFSFTPVLANDVADVVRARANARAGGGTSGHDAWVLKRHGRLSGSGSSSSRYLAKKKAAKKRALWAAKAKARKAAAARRCARIAAKKKKAAQRRAYLLAKKKAKQKRAYALAQKKKKAKFAAIAAKKKAKKKQLAAITQDMVEADQKESAFVATPSTATVMINQDRAPETADVTPVRSSTTADIAVIETNPAALTLKETETTGQNIGSKDDNANENCKRYLPAIGLTISIGC